MYVVEVTEEGTLLSRGRAAIAKDFILRGEDPGGGGGDPVPDYVSGSHPHTWIAPVYNPGSNDLALLRGLCFAGLTGIANGMIAFLGDSTGEGFDSGPAATIWRTGWVGQAAAAMGAVAGYLVAIPNSRWSGNMVQKLIRDPGLFNAPGLGADETLTYEVPHTGGTFLVNAPTGGTLTVIVDGGAPQAIPIPAGPNFREITPTVSGAESQHVYRVTSPDQIQLHGFRPTYATPRLKFANFSRGGMNAQAWMPGDRPNGLGHWDGMLAAVDPDAIACALGINQPGDDGTVGAANLTALWAQIAALNVPSLVITPGGLDLTGPEDWFSQYEAQFDAADLYDFPLLDFASVIGTGQDAQARGFMADTIHPNKLGFAYLAAAFVRLLGPAARGW